MDGPAYLPVGTEVSAKYRGAFCEAKVKKIVRAIKIKVCLAETGLPLVVSDEDIKGPLKVGCTVEVKHPESGQFVAATINKITDQSMYTVVFDDSDENTLRRTQLCLKGEKHFVKTDTLDELPLTHPEHFGTPVMKGNKKKRRSAPLSSESESEQSSDEAPRRKYWGKLQDLIGKVFCMQQDDRKKSMIIPVLVVHPNADNIDLKTREHILVKSFKDSKIYPVLKKELKEFTRETAMKNDDKALKPVYEKALLYFDAKELPQNWDKEEVLGTESSDDDDDEASSDDEQSEEKDMFVAQLYKFMDDRGTPINKAPVIGTRDLNLYRLFRVVGKFGGYNRVTNQMKWRLVYSKMLLPNSATAANQIKTGYKKYLHAYEDFYRKLGSSMGTITRPSRSRHGSGRNIPGFRDRGERMESSPRSPRSGAASASAAKKPKDEVVEDKTDETKSQESKISREKGTHSRVESSNKTDQSEVDSPSKRKTRTTLEEKNSKFGKDKKTTVKEEPEALSKEDANKVKKRPIRKKVEKQAVIKLEELDIKKSSSAGTSMVSETITKEEVKDADVDDDDDDDASDEDFDAQSNKTTGSDDTNTKNYEEAEYPPGSKLKLKYGKGKNQTYFEAKVLDCENEGGAWHYLVHYNGWNVRYDEWVKRDRVVECVYKSDGKRPILSGRPTLPGAKLQAMKKKMVMSKAAKAETTQKGEMDKDEKALKSSTVPSNSKAVTKDSKPRPTRSTSMENNLSVGLAGLSNKRRRRRNSGYSETSKSRLSYDDSSESDNDEDDDDDEDEDDEDDIASINKSQTTSVSSGKDTSAGHIFMDSSGDKSPHSGGPDSRESAFDIIKELQASASEMEFDKASQESLERDLNIKVPDRGKHARDDSDEDMDIDVLLSCLKTDEYKFPSSESESVKSDGPEKRVVRGKTKTKGELKGRPDLSKLFKSEAVRPKVDSTAVKPKVESNSRNKADVTKKVEVAKPKIEVVKTKASELPRAKIELSKLKPETVQPKGDATKPKPEVTSLVKGKPDKVQSKIKPEVQKTKVENVVKTKAEMKMIVPFKEKEIAASDKPKEMNAESPQVSSSNKEKELEKVKPEKVLSSGDEQSSVDKTRGRKCKEPKDSDIEKEDKGENLLDTPTKTRGGRGRGKRKIVEKETEDSEDEPLKKKTKKKIKKAKSDEEKSGPPKLSSPSTDDTSKDEGGQSSQESGPWVNAPELTATPKLELDDMEKGDDDIPDEQAPPLSPVHDMGAEVSSNQTDSFFREERSATISTEVDSVPAAAASQKHMPVVEEQGEDEPTYVKPNISAVIDNTPPQTPENVSANPTPHHDVTLEVCSTRSEMEANFEVEKYLQGARPPGEDSPSVYDPSNVSTASDESVNLDKGVEGGSDYMAGASNVKRKSIPEDCSQPAIKKKRSIKKIVNKVKQDQKRGLSDFEDEDSKDGMSKDVMLGTSKQLLQPSSSTLSGGSYPALSKDFPMGPPKYDFVQQLDEAKYLEREQRVNFLFGKISDLRNVYMQLKAEVASIDRKRKRYRKKQRLAQEAAAQCLIGLEQSVL